MKDITVLLCCAIFLVAGGYLARYTTEKEVIKTQSYKAIQASTLPTYQFPPITRNQKSSEIDLSEDLVRDLAKKKGVLDTVYITKTDTIKEQVTKVKWRKAAVASPVMEINVTKSRTDTIQVPVYYLATQIGNKEGPNNESIPIYELRKVDEIRPHSSVKPINELDSIAGAEL